MPETEEAADVLAITGEVLYSQHRLKAARQYTLQALLIREKMAGQEDPDFATTLNNLGVIASEQKRTGEAEALLSRALAIRQARFGPEHPHVASTLLSLSRVYLEQKRYTEAEEACRRSLEMIRRFLPASHANLVSAQIGLALIVRRSGDSLEAIHILEEAVRSVGIPRGEHVRLLNLYSQYLGDAGEKEKARRVRLEARQLAEQAARTPPGGYTVTLSELEAGGATSRWAENPSGTVPTRAHRF